MNRKIVTFISLALIAVLAVGQVFTAGRGFSKMENRYLASMPKAEWETVSSGAWMQQLETYLADHVPARDEWVQMKNTMLQLTGRKQIGQVVYAGDDRLIQVQDISMEQLKKNVQLISDFAAVLPEQVRFNLLVAPNASWIYQNLLPEETQTYDPEQALEILQTEMSQKIRLIVPYDTLKQHKNEAIYFKTDHHWTMRGAAYAYRALAEELDMMGQDPFEYNIEISKLKFLGSIYSQAPSFGFEGEMFEIFQVPGLEATWTTGLQSGPVLDREKLSEKDQYAAFFGGNYGFVRIENERARSDEKLLILKDSYANILVPFLIEDYREIIMVDLRYYKGSVKALATEEAVDQILAIYNMDFLCTDQSFVWLGVGK